MKDIFFMKVKKMAYLRKCLDCNKQISSASEKCIKCNSPKPFGVLCCSCHFNIPFKESIQKNGKYFHKKCLKKIQEEINKPRKCSACKKEFFISIGSHSTTNCSNCGHPNKNTFCSGCNLPTLGSEKHKACITGSDQFKKGMCFIILSFFLIAFTVLAANVGFSKAVGTAIGIIFFILMGIGAILSGFK